MKDYAEEFRKRYKIVDNCWEWQGYTNDYGYAMFWDGNKQMLAHRWIYTQTTNTSPEILDHVCRNRACVNPEHLRPSTRTLNGENRSIESTYSNTGYRNVRWVPEKNLFRVNVKHQRKQHFGGYYKTLEEAILAAADLRKRLHEANECDK